MTYGWNTKKQANGTYTWSVNQTIWNAEAGRATSETLHSGTKRTRARAAGQAKRVCLHYRRKAA